MQDPERLLVDTGPTRSQSQHSDRAEEENGPMPYLTGASRLTRVSRVPWTSSHSTGCQGRNNMTRCVSHLRSCRLRTYLLPLNSRAV